MDKLRLSNINSSVRPLIVLIVSVLIFAAAVTDISGSEPGDTAKLNNYIRLGFRAMKAKSKSPEIQAYIDSALQIIDKENLEAPSLLSLLRAEYSLNTSDFRGASIFAENTLNKAIEEKNDRVQALVTAFFGNFYLRTGSFQESIDYFDKSIQIATKSGIKKIIPGSIEGQANVFRAMGDLKTYGVYLGKMIQSSYLEKDTASISRSLYLLGTLHAERLRDPELCDSLLRKCFYISRLTGDTTYMALSLANLGWNYYLSRSFDSSIVCYNRSLSLSVPARQFGNAANAFGNLGTIYRDLNNFEKAIDYYNKSIQMALKVNDYYNLQWVYNDMSYLYLMKKDTSNAYLTFVKHKKYSDEYLIKSSSQGLIDAKMKFEVDTHNKEVELLSLKIKNQKLLMFGSVGLTVLAVAVSFLLYRGSKLKARRRISEMNRTISELTQANLRQQMNPHFIFNTLNSIQYYMYQHDKIATNNYLTKFTSLMRKVLENSQHTSVTIKDELEALNLYLELESLRFKDKFDYHITVDEEIDPMLFKIPTMLIQPYVENSICHGMMPGESKGLLRIDLKLEKDCIRCIIEDNGIGREEAQKRKKDQGTNHNSLGTRIVASRLDLVNSLYGTSLRTIYTDLKNEAGEPAGTRVEIHIPIIS